MPDIKKVKLGLECCRAYYINHDLDGHDRCPYNGLKGGKGCNQLYADALELLKEQEAVVKQWTKEIADNQLSHAPNDSHEFMSLDEHLENEYKRGIWDGLQIAWNIISEGR